MSLHPVNSLNDKASLQRKNISTIGQSVKSLNKQFNTVVNDFKSHCIDCLETRIMQSTEKALFEAIVSWVPATYTPSLNEVASQIQLRSLKIFNILILWFPESLMPLFSE